MKTRFLIAAMLLMAFGTMKAQVNEPQPQDPKKDSTVVTRKPDMSQFPELMRELGEHLQALSDSVDWESFEQDMEQWGADMEEWGRKMEQWGEQFEEKYGDPCDWRYLPNGDPQVHAIQVEGSGDVRIKQSQDQFSLRRDDKSVAHHYITNGTLILSGASDYEVAMQQLDEIILRSSGDMVGRGTIKGNNLHIIVRGSGDLRLNVDYDTIRVEMSGSGDVTLMGQCKVIYGEILGSGDLQIPQLYYENSQIDATGSGEVRTNGYREVISHKYNREQKNCKRTLYFDPHWNGFEAGLNMLVSPTLTDVYVSTGGTNGMELRPLRSWYFGFNIADAGFAFNRRHTMGMFTGIGLGWNNFSWNNDVTVGYDNDNVINTLVPVDTSLVVTNSKYGALFLQAPLMLEIRPTRNMYIDLGATAGLRIAQWDRVKYDDGNSDKHYFSGPLNQFKLDASLRVGSENIGFFANYALLPIFSFGNEEQAHPISFGFSINF